MSSPVPIVRKGSGSFGSCTPLGTSPNCPSGSSPPRGCSPPTRSSVEKYASHASAKKFWKKLCFDPTVDSDECTVGFLDSVLHQERRSGAEAWSMRVHDALVDIPFQNFVQRFSAGDIPFHRISYFKMKGSVAWESEYHRKKTPDTPSAQLFQRRPPQNEADKVSNKADGWAGQGIEEGQEGDNMTPGVVPQLPEQCWMQVLKELSVRELCTVARVNSWLRTLVGHDPLWRRQYEWLFGEAASAEWPSATVRRMCRRSELRAARWLDAAVSETPGMGPPRTTCLLLDDTKVVSADGSAVRLWSHSTGRKIATLKGHTAPITCLAADDTLLASADTSGALRLWTLDDLKCVRSLRGADADAPIRCACIAHGNAVTGSEDGAVCLWTPAHSSPITTASSSAHIWGGHAATPALYGMHVNPQTGLLATAGSCVAVWDMSAMMVLQQYGPPEGSDQGAAYAAPYTCVASAGKLLIAGREGRVDLWDQRCQQPVGSILSALPRTALLPQTEGGERSPLLSSRACIGVALDEWKVTLAFRDSPAALHVHDIRSAAAPSSRAAAALEGGNASGWQRPVMSITGPARLNCFQVHNELLVAGCESAPCVVWSFQSPNATAVDTPGTTSAMDPQSGEDILGSSPPGDKRSLGRKKPVKVGKKQTRYPKRSTK